MNSIMNKYSVSIIFDCGSYHASVDAKNEQDAYDIALVDARTNFNFSCHFGKVTKQTIVED